MSVISFPGFNDQTYCFWCGEGLEEWKEIDDPENEHIRWYPNCQYINNIRNRRRPVRRSKYTSSCDVSPVIIFYLK